MCGLKPGTSRLPSPITKTQRRMRERFNPSKLNVRDNMILIFNLRRKEKEKKKIQMGK